MTQYDTNMKLSSYYAYCHAYVACFVQGVPEHDRMSYDDAVRAGIVFG